MHWTERFSRQVMSMDDAVALVANGDAGDGRGCPNRRRSWRPWPPGTIWPTWRCSWGRPGRGGGSGRQPGITLYAGFLTEAVRAAELPVEVLPVHFSGTPGFIRRWAPRIRVVLVAEPTDDGVVHPGSSVANDDDLVNGPGPDGAVVIGIVDPNQPRLRGHTYPVEAFDGWCPSRPTPRPPFYDSRRVSAHIDAFVAHIDPLIPDGATLQSGVGGLPEAIMARSATSAIWASTPR